MGKIYDEFMSLCFLATGLHLLETPSETILKHAALRVRILLPNGNLWLAYRCKFGKRDQSSLESLVQWISATSVTVGLQVFCHDFFIFGYAKVRFLMGNPSSEHPSPLGLGDKDLSKNIVYKPRSFSTKGWKENEKIDLFRSIKSMIHTKNT